MTESAAPQPIKDDPQVFRRLGMAYEAGWGVPRDDAKAVVYFRVAAEQGDVTAKMYLFAMYRAGRGGVVVDELFLTCLRDLAGAPGPQCALAELYLAGEFVDRDEEAALSWYIKAAHSHSYDGEMGAARIYARGVGAVERDVVQAHMWFNIATIDNDKESAAEARRERDALAAQMSPEEIAGARQLVREWGANRSCDLREQLGEGRRLWAWLRSLTRHA